MNKMQSDIQVNSAVFDPKAVSPEIHAINERLRKGLAESFDFDDPSTSLAAYRTLLNNGEVYGGEAPALPSGTSLSIPSRESGRNIPCRLFSPSTSAPAAAAGAAVKVFLHLHGGGYVLHTEKYMDRYLERLSHSCNMHCLSVGYRLAPEHRYPAAVEDCIDAAEWVVRHGLRTFGHESVAEERRQLRMMIGGESAGAHAALMTTLHLLRKSSSSSSSKGTAVADTQRYLKGIILNYPLTYAGHTPSTHTLSKSPSLVLDTRLLETYIQTFLPVPETTTRQDPSISPLYADLAPLRSLLPPVLFTVGSEDILLEDSLFMAVRWQVAGAEAVVKVLPGAPHGYLENPDLEADENVRRGVGYVEEFVGIKMMG